MIDEIGKLEPLHKALLMLLVGALASNRGELVEGLTGLLRRSGGPDGRAIEGDDDLLFAAVETLPERERMWWGAAMAQAFIARDGEASEVLAGLLVRRVSN